MTVRIYTADELSNAEYHARPDLGSTTLRKWLGLKRYAVAPDNPTPAQVKSRALGTCTHSLVLEGREDWATPVDDTEPENVATAHAAIAALKAEGVTRRGKEGKAKHKPHDDAVAAWEAELAERREAHQADAEKRGLYFLPPADVECVQAMAEAVRDNPIAAAMIDSAESCESSIFWTERVELDGEIVEVPCKCRPDVLVWDAHADGYVVADLKSTRSELTATALAKTSANLRYPMQAAFYRRGVEATGKPVSSCMTIWTASAEPYGCEVTQFTDDDLEAADRLVDRALRRYAEHLKSPDAYGGIGQGPTITTLRIPRWWATATETE